MARISLPTVIHPGTSVNPDNRRNPASGGSGLARRPGWVRQVDQALEQVAQRLRVAAVGGDAGRFVLVWVHPDPVHVMPSVVRELGEERPLSPAVALTERVQRVDIAEELRQPADE